MKPHPSRNALPIAQRRCLFVSLFLAGGCTLVLELAGARVVSPYYGSSLYTWSAIITVTLVALAAGYNLGGRAADRNPALILFAKLLVAAGLCTALIPALRTAVLQATTPLGVQLGALASATVLIGPPLVLLSALGPLAVRLLAESVAVVGKSAGDAYALSTAGSVLGATLAGFALIPHLRLSHILYGTAVLLLLLGAWTYWICRQKAPAAQLAAAAAAALVGFWPRHEPATNMLHNAESAYGQIKVLDFGPRRYLLVNGTTQSMALLSDLTETDSQYCHAMEWALLARPLTKRALVIGAGAGLLQTAIEKHYGVIADTVEIDPAMIAAARRYFGFAPRGDVFVEDGRLHLERNRRRYGVVFLDAFGSESPPYHLFTAESFAAARRSLEPGGILAVNVVSRLAGAGEPWRSAYKTLGGVFAHVRAFQGGPEHEGLGNVVLFASDVPLPEGGPTMNRARPRVRPDLAFMLDHELSPAPGELDAALSMTDDHAPMEALMAESAASWRRSLQQKIPQLLLY